MAEFPKFCLALLLAFSLVGFSVPARSPGPAPDFGADSPHPLAPAPNFRAPANPPSNSPALVPSPSPSKSQTPSPSKSLTPTPKPSDAGDINHEKTAAEGSSSGMSRGKKAGIVIGVLVGAGLIVMGGMIYKKRRNNIRRSQYANAARREIQ